MDELPRQWLQRATVIVAAHPDDEVIGVGALLPKFVELRAIVHVTDGAPRSSVKDWQEYARARRREFQAAMREAGIDDKVQQICLECPDQEASFRMAELAYRLRGVFEELRPECVFTHPYEGGHPDHDATAFAVHGAVNLLRAADKPAPIILEFASYHAGAGGMETGCFLSEVQELFYEHALSDEEVAAKRRLFACYVSQRGVLQYFPIGREPLRVAPRYDFTRAPHLSKLYYEHFSWGVIGSEWRELAVEALRALEWNA